MDRPRYWRFSCSKPARFFPCIVVPWIKHSAQHVDRHTTAQLSRSQPSFSSSGLSGYLVAHGSRVLKPMALIKLMGILDQPDIATEDSTGTVSPTQPHGMSTQHSSTNWGCILTATSQGTVGDLAETQANPEKSTSHALSTAKDITVVAWSFTEMFLKRLPDAVHINPANIAVGIVKIILQIKDVCRCSSCVLRTIA